MKLDLNHMGYFTEFGENNERMAIPVEPEDIELIDKLVGVMQHGRREGLLALECNDQLGIHDPLFLLGLQLIVDGTDPDWVEEIMMNVIITSCPESSIDFRRSLIILKGIQCVQYGVNPTFGEVILRSFLGKCIYDSPYISGRLS